MENAIKWLWEARNMTIGGLVLVAIGFVFGCLYTRYKMAEKISLLARRFAERCSGYCGGSADNYENEIRDDARRVIGIVHWDISADRDVRGTPHTTPGGTTSVGR